MAATFENIVRRNEIQLEAVWGMTEDMEEVAAEWQELAEWERASYALEWDNYAGTVRNMIADFHMGKMVPGQQQKLLELLRRLDDLRPVFAQLHLSWPDVSSMVGPDATKATIAAHRSQL